MLPDVTQANKLSKPPKQPEPPKAKPDENRAGTTQPPEEEQASSKKRKIEFLDMTNDDDEEQPLKIVKVEVSENDTRFPIPGSQKQNNDAEKSQARPTDRPKSQRQI